jgi:hypothetical protein
MPMYRQKAEVNHSKYCEVRRIRQNVRFECFVFNLIFDFVFQINNITT